MDEKIKKLNEEEKQQLVLVKKRNEVANRVKCVRRPLLLVRRQAASSSLSRLPASAARRKLEQDIAREQKQQSVANNIEKHRADLKKLLVKRSQLATDLAVRTGARRWAVRLRVDFIGSAPDGPCLPHRRARSERVLPARAHPKSRALGGADHSARRLAGGHAALDGRRDGHRRAQAAPRAC